MGSSAVEAAARGRTAPADAAAGGARAAPAGGGGAGGRVASIDHLRALSMLGVIAHHFAGCGMMALCFARPESVRDAWSDELLLPGSQRSLLRVWPRLLTKMTFASFLYTSGYVARQKEVRAFAAAKRAAIARKCQREAAAKAESDSAMEAGASDVGNGESESSAAVASSEGAALGCACLALDGAGTRALRAWLQLARATLLEPLYVACAWVAFVGPITHALLEEYGWATPLRAGENSAGHMWFIFALVAARAMIMALNAAKVGKHASLATMLCVGLSTCALWPAQRAVDGLETNFSVKLWHQPFRPQVFSLCYWYGWGYLLGDDTEEVVAGLRAHMHGRKAAALGLAILAVGGASLLPLDTFTSGTVVPYSVVHNPERLLMVLTVDIPYMASCIVLWLVLLPNAPVPLWSAMGQTTMTTFLWHQSAMAFLKSPALGLFDWLAALPPLVALAASVLVPWMLYVACAAPFMCQKRLAEGTFALYTAAAFTFAGVLLWCTRQRFDLFEFEFGGARASQPRLSVAAGVRARNVVRAALARGAEPAAD